ncbi:MAG: TolC family protein [Planctomycetota bacterium]
MKTKLLAMAGLVLAGCAVPEDAGFEDVRKPAEERTGKKVHWFRGGPEDDEVRRTLENLFREELTPETAVQIALFNNPGLQAQYEDLGVAQADLVQAGILKNPTLMAGAHFPTRSGINTGLEFEIVQEFLDLLMFPARRELASHEFERVKLRVSDDVVDVAARTKAAWFEVVAAQQTAEVHHAIAAAAEARADLAKRLKDAGNLSELAVARETDEAESAKRAWSKAENEVLEARERLTVLLGAWGAQVSWTAPKKLPELPAGEIPLAGLESLAIARRLDLAAAIRERDASASRLQLVKAFRWFGTIELGAGVHREPEPEVGWLVGPSLALSLPIFDRQQAVIFALEAELRRRESLDRDLAVRIRAETRTARNRLVSTRRLAEHQQKVVIPLRERIVDLSLKEYNFMLIGIAEVLRAREAEYEAYEESIELVRDYWIARTELERAVGGRLPEPAR